ncbi:MAG: PLP-dependent transferase [Verrucomicrobia bacterium]|nr:PLP-dependent transferase [Verrucomicrobiota bacterium]
MDPTIASPHNVHILPYADIHINSLTKYAGNRGDVMCGAVALNRDSRFYDQLKAGIEPWISAPATADLKRLAWQMRDYGATVDAVNHNTPIVADFLQRHPKINQVWWAESATVVANFNRIRQANGGPGAMISFTVKGDWQVFTIACAWRKHPASACNSAYSVRSCISPTTIRCADRPDAQN